MSRPPPMIARETATPEPDHARPEGLSVGHHSPSLATRGCGGASRDRHASDLLARLTRVSSQIAATPAAHGGSSRRNPSFGKPPRYIVLRNRRRRGKEVQLSPEKGTQRSGCAPFCLSYCT